MSSASVFGKGSETPDVANSFRLQLFPVPRHPEWNFLAFSGDISLAPSHSKSARKVINMTIKSKLCSALENYEKPGEKGGEL